MKTDNEQLDAVITQEKELRFKTVDTGMVTDIAKAIADKLKAKHAPSYILAVINGNTLYAECLPGASPDNANWVRRKGNLTTLFSKSSYRVTLEMRIRGQDLSSRGASAAEYVLSGGAFPVTIGDLTVGYFASSGIAQEEEHQIIADTIAGYLGKKIPSVSD